MRLIREEKTFIREAVLLMLPMILQNFVTFSMSMADTFMVGVLGETALAAVTMANSPFYVMQLMIFGVQSGMSVLVAQYHGRGDQEAINRVMGIALFVSTTITGLLAITAFCIPEQIMRVLTNNADLVAPGAAYTRYVGFSYFFSAISGVYIAAQRSTENPRLGAVLLTVSGALNIFLNWVLIYGKLGAPMLGCAGAAVATLISRAFEVAVLCVYAAVSRRLPLMPRALLHPGRVIAKDFAKYALPVVCNECLWSLAFSLYTVIMGHMDNNTPILSAYTIAGNLQRMMTPASFAAGGAAAVLIGREIGRGNRGSVQRKAWVLDALALVVGFVCMGIIALVRNVLLRPYILPLMHMEGEACDIAMYMMGILMLVQPVSSVSLTNIVGVLRGGGDGEHVFAAAIFIFHRAHKRLLSVKMKSGGSRDGCLRASGRSKLRVQPRERGGLRAVAGELLAGSPGAGGVGGASKGDRVVLHGDAVGAGRCVRFFGGRDRADAAEERGAEHNGLVFEQNRLEVAIATIGRVVVLATVLAIGRGISVTVDGGVQL